MSQLSGHCQSIVTSSAECKASEGDTGMILVLASFMDSLYHVGNKMMHALLWLECYFGVYFPRCCATREKNTKITLAWAHKQFTTQVHTLYSMTWFGASISHHLYQASDSSTFISIRPLRPVVTLSTLQELVYDIEIANRSVKNRKHIYSSDVQVHTELYGNFRCLQVFYSK